MSQCGEYRRRVAALTCPRPVSGEHVRLSEFVWRSLGGGLFFLADLQIVAGTTDHPYERRYPRYRDHWRWAHWAFGHILRWPIDGLGTLEG